MFSDYVSINGGLMKVEEFERLVDYVADLRAKLQHAKARHDTMVQSMQLLVDCDVEMVELSAWADTMDEHEQFVENLKTELTAYEKLLDWPLTTEFL